MPTATIEAALHTTRPDEGKERDCRRAPRIPPASAAGRRAGATLSRSFCPSSRKSAPIPKTFAATATAPRTSAIGIASAGGRSASAAPAAREERQHAERAGEQRAGPVDLRRRWPRAREARRSR